MKNKTAVYVLGLLREGIDPVTGEILPFDHVCNSSIVIEALETALAALGEARDPMVRKDGRLNAGRPWTQDDEAQLEALYRAGTDINVICAQLQRRPRGVQKQLRIMGLIEGEVLQQGRAGTPWTEAEEKRLIQLFEARETIADIAKLLARSEYSIFCRMQKLKLFADVPGYPTADSPLPWQNSRTRR